MPLAFNNPAIFRKFEMRPDMPAFVAKVVWGELPAFPLLH